MNESIRKMSKFYNEKNKKIKSGVRTQIDDWNVIFGLVGENNFLPKN